MFIPYKIIFSGTLIIGLIYYLRIGRFLIKSTSYKLGLTHKKLIFMMLRGSPVQVIASELIRANKNGIALNCDEIESYYISGADIKKEVDLLISKSK